MNARSRWTALHRELTRLMNRAQAETLKHAESADYGAAHESDIEEAVYWWVLGVMSDLDAALPRPEDD